MSNPTFRDLTRKMRSGRITRRHFIQSASALGISATSISSALRANPAHAQDGSTVTFWTVATEPDLSALQMIVDNFNSENSDVQAELVQVVGDETDTTKLDDGRPRRHRTRRLYARPLHRRPACR